MRPKNPASIAGRASHTSPTAPADRRSARAVALAPAARVLFKGGRFDVVPDVVPITSATAAHRLPAHGTSRGTIVVQVRGPRGWRRCYFRGVATFSVDRGQCACCSSTVVSGEFVIKARRQAASTPATDPTTENT